MEDDTSKILCRYFMSNVCVFGSSCRFSHDRSSRPDLVCRYYLKGGCSYGDQCRFDHVRNRGNVMSSNTTPERKTGESSPTAINAVASLNSVAPPLRHNLVPLGKGGQPKKFTSSMSLSKNDEEWVKAKEFVPQVTHQRSVPPSYADVATAYESDAGAEATYEYYYETEQDSVDPDSLCPFMVATGQCHDGDACIFLHGDLCDMCDLHILHPTNAEQRKQHEKECLESFEKNMEHSFAMAASTDKTCEICMDTVMKKEVSSERRFGILEKCRHCFCLSCIREWRSKEVFEKTHVRTCPTCRVVSNFIVPSKVWVDSPEKKTKLIEDYKDALKEKPCQYFQQGKGECPFSSSCFYKHALPDGTISVPPKPRKYQNSDGEVVSRQSHVLWEFLETEQMRRDIAAESDIFTPLSRRH